LEKPHLKGQEPAMNDAKKPARSTAKAGPGFTAEERAALKDRSEELKAARRPARGAKVDGESDALAKIGEMAEPDRAMAEQLHALIKSTAPELSPKTWYGMPAYAKGSDIVCFFQPAQKFKSRYATLGFSDKAHLDDGGMWPTYYALQELTPAEEKKISALIRKALS
jgi:uncharacterized protein YdhG (YjbR/CyaY superfamily)